MANNNNVSDVTIVSTTITNINNEKSEKLPEEETAEKGEMSETERNVISAEGRMEGNDESEGNTQTIKTRSKTQKHKAFNISNLAGIEDGPVPNNNNNNNNNNEKGQFSEGDTEGRETIQNGPTSTGTTQEIEGNESSTHKSPAKELSSNISKLNEGVKTVKQEDGNGNDLPSPTQQQMAVLNHLGAGGDNPLPVMTSFYGSNFIQSLTQSPFRPGPGVYPYPPSQNTFPTPQSSSAYLSPYSFPFPYPSLTSPCPSSLFSLPPTPGTTPGDGGMEYQLSPAVSAAISHASNPNPNCNPNGSQILVSKRTEFSVKQKRRLEQAYMKDPYPSRMTKNRLCRELHLTYTQIVNWFQNRRNRHKQLQKEQDTMNHRLAAELELPPFNYAHPLANTPYNNISNATMNITNMLGASSAESQMDEPTTSGMAYNFGKDANGQNDDGQYY